MSKSQVRRLSEHLPDIAKELKTVTVVVGNTDRFETLVYVTPAFAQSLADQVSAATTRLSDLKAGARRKSDALAVALLWAMDAEGGYTDLTKKYYDWATAVKEKIPGNPQMKDVLDAALSQEPAEGG